MPFLVFKSKSLKLFFVTILMLILVCVTLSTTRSTSVFFGYTSKNHPIYAVDRTDNYVSLTFDAAWGADKTTKIVEILNSYGIKATFFLVGFWVEKYPEMAQLIATNGMEIATHSNTHPDMTKLSAEEIELELDTAAKTIKDTTGAEVNLFRPPYGSYDDKLLNVCNSLGYKTIKWSVDTHDWMGKNTEYIVTRVLDKIRSGGIILFHNNSDYVLDALPIVIDRLLMKGYKFTTVGDLVYSDNYYIDRTGLQRQNI